MNTTSDIYFASVLHYLEALGLSKQFCLEQIDFAQFSALPKGTRIPFRYYHAILELGKLRCQDSLFGFHLGQDIRTADYGVLGYLIESSCDLAAAIDTLLQYDSLVADIGTAQFSCEGDTASICWTPNQLCSEQVVLRNMTAWVAVVRRLLDPSLTPSRLLFVHNFSSQEQERLSEWFGCQVISGATVNQIDFPHDYLQVQFSSDNPFMHQALTQLSQKQLADIQAVQSVSQRVLSILMSKHDLQGVNQERVAQALNLTPRTLQRKLKHEQCSFADLRDEERKRRYELLMNQHSLGTIAALLGFNEQSSFNRAFKRWYGCAPKDYRANNTTR